MNNDGYVKIINNGKIGSYISTSDNLEECKTKSRNNPLRSVVKEGEGWCLCQDRYFEAKIANKAPKVIKNVSHKNIKPSIKKSLCGISALRSPESWRLKEFVDLIMRL